MRRKVGVGLPMLRAVRRQRVLLLGDGALRHKFIIGALCKEKAREVELAPVIVAKRPLDVLARFGNEASIA